MELPAPVYSNSLCYRRGQLPMSIVVNSFKWQPVAMALRADGQLPSAILSAMPFTWSHQRELDAELLTGGNGVGWRDGSPQYAKFDQPHGIAASADGRMVVCDMMNNRVRIIDREHKRHTFTGRPATSGQHPMRCRSGAFCRLGGRRAGN